MDTEVIRKEMKMMNLIIKMALNSGRNELTQAITKTMLIFVLILFVFTAF